MYDAKIGLLLHKSLDEFLNPNDKVLFRLFSSKKHESPLKSVYADGYFFVCDNFLPCLCHTFTPIYIIENDECVVVNVV